MRNAALLLILLAAPAAAETIAVATSSAGASITLTTERGPCVGEARVAIWRSPDAQVSVPGCWVIAGKVVAVSFLDGDRGIIPLADFRKPASL